MRVLIADDHKELRQGLVQLMASQPGIQVVGEAGNGLEALQLSIRLRPDVVIMDVSMPVMNGVEATRQIKAEVPKVRVIGLSMFDDEYISRTMKYAGAESFVNKTASMTGLMDALQPPVSPETVARPSGSYDLRQNRRPD